MELIQVYWDDSMNLFLEFQKETPEERSLQPEMIKKLNLKYEIIKIGKDNFNLSHPTLVSIKDFFFTENKLVFFINLREIRKVDDLEINFIEFSISLASGKRKKYPLSKKLNLEDIIIEQDVPDFKELAFSQTVITKEVVNSTIRKEIITSNSKSTSLERENRELSIYKENSLTKHVDANLYFSTIKENNERLARVEEELKNLTETLKHLSSNGINLPSPTTLSQPAPAFHQPAQPLKPTPSIKRIPGLPLKSTSSKAPFIGELKSIFNKITRDKGEFDFRTILKPMSEDELDQITLTETEIQKREEIVIIRKIERFAEENSKIISLEKLKKPA